MHYNVNLYDLKKHQTYSIIEVSKSPKREYMVMRRYDALGG